MAAKSKMAPNADKILFLLPNGQFNTNFQKKCAFYWWYQHGTINYKNPRWRSKTIECIFVEILRIFTNVKRQNFVQGSKIHLKMAEISKMAFDDIFNEMNCFGFLITDLS
jgi:hypothetical protein